MTDWTRSFLALLAEAGVRPRIVDGRLVANLSGVPPLWAADCRHLLTTYCDAIVAELRSQEGRFPARAGTETAFRAFRDALGAAS